MAKSGRICKFASKVKEPFWLTDKDGKEYLVTPCTNRAMFGFSRIQIRKAMLDCECMQWEKNMMAWAACTRHKHADDVRLDK